MICVECGSNSSCTSMALGSKLCRYCAPADPTSWPPDDEVKCCVVTSVSVGGRDDAPITEAVWCWGDGKGESTVG